MLRALLKTAYSTRCNSEPRHLHHRYRNFRIVLFEMTALLNFCFSVIHDVLTIGRQWAKFMQNVSVSAR